MTVVESYAVAVAMCVVTMLCWGSWANTQKLATKEWRFELFYWDYAIGVLLFALVLAFTAGYAAATHADDSRDPSRFTYARLYCGPEGDTHFQDVTAELGKTNFAPPAPPIYIGSDFSASRAFFGGFDATWGAQDLEKRLNHPTPAVQFGIVLQGVFSITVTDGETRRLPPGSVFRLEDTSPCKGHITVVGDKTGFLMFVR